MFAGLAIWDAYPEWGDMVKINYISLYIAIGLVLLNITIYFINKYKKIQN